MIRGVFAIDLSRELSPSWDNDRRARGLISNYLHDPDARRLAVEIQVGNRQAPTPVGIETPVDEHWRDLAATAPALQVKGGIHVGDWLRFLERARREAAA